MTTETQANGHAPGAAYPRATPRVLPREGDVFPIQLATGVAFYRVLKANAERIVLVPLSELETRRLVAGMQAAAESEAPWWRRWLPSWGRR